MNTEEAFDFSSEFSLDTQKRFLTLLVYEKDWSELTGLDLIKPEYFENKLLHNICVWIHRHYKQYKTAPSMTVLVESASSFINDTPGLSQRDYFQYKKALDDIFNLGENENLNFFKDKAIDFARQVAWKKAMNSAVACLKGKKYAEAMKMFSDILMIGSEEDLGIDFGTFDIDSFLSSLSTKYDPKTMVHTGIPSWDKALGGGFVKNNLHIIGAQPGGGKSRIMAYLAKHALEELKRVVYITLELDEQDTMSNILLATVGMNLADLRNPDNRQEMIEKITLFRDSFSANLMVKFYKPSTITANVIHNYIQKIIRVKKEKEGIDWKPDVIFLDYMDKLLPIDNIKGNIYEDNGGVADDCKNLAIDFDCPVITGSQLGRGSWNIKGDEVISMSSIAESARKAHLAHSLTTINANPQEKKMNLARLYVAKSRSGTTGEMIYLNHNLARCTFYEAEPWKQEDIMNSTDFTVKDTNGGSAK